MSPDDPTKRVMVIAKVSDLTREEMIKALTRHYAEMTGDALLTPLPPAALAVFDVPTPVKKNRADRRKEARRGR